MEEEFNLYLLNIFMPVGLLIICIVLQNKISVLGHSRFFSQVSVSQLT